MNNVPENLPSTIGIYIFKTLKGEILYIGKSVNIKARIKSHFESAKLDLKERAIIEGSDKIETIATESEFKALILESSLIQKFRPKYNKIWMDDKSYLYVRFSMGEEYPKISMLRRSDIESSNFQIPNSKFQKDPSDLKSPQDDVSVNSKPKKSNKDLYFGPFSSRRTLENLLREIRRVIPFCTSKRLTKSACFYSKIGLCQPCPNYINQLIIKNYELRIEENESGIVNRELRKIEELKKEYKNNIKEIIKIFEGKVEIVLKDLRKELSQLSKEQKYEEALHLKNRIERFERLISERGFNDNYELKITNYELISEALKKILNKYFPDLVELHRIECYDVSNLNFKEITAAMTVAVEGQVDKSQYRKFGIKNSELRIKNNDKTNFQIQNSNFQKSLRTTYYVQRTGPVDWELMKSVFLRRFKHLEWEFPNLLVVDGGKPQVRMAVQCMLDLNLQIPVVGIAKNPDRLVIGTQDLPTIRPELNNSGFNLIRLLRDEAHRFGRKYHLFLREKKITRI
jgi:excinuclease ABC subunit C